MGLSAARKPRRLSDHIALAIVRLLRVIAASLFAGRYGHRAVVLETVAAVPGMVGAMLQHMSGLRRMRDHGWVRILLDEAENERMHLMTFIKVAEPNLFERALILLAQGVFFNLYFVAYVLSPRSAHRFVGYFAQDAARSYGEYLDEIRSDRHEDVPAPQIAIDYWKMAPGARLSDVVVQVRKDEVRHRDINHALADSLERRRAPRR